MSVIFYISLDLSLRQVPSIRCIGAKGSFPPSGNYFKLPVVQVAEGFYCPVPLIT